MKLSSRVLLVEVTSLVIAGGVGWSVGCASGNTDEFFGPDGGPISISSNDAANLGSGPGSTPAGQCVECLSNTNCGSQVCAQVQGDSFCASPCGGGGGGGGGEGSAACPTGTTCSIESAYNGAQVSVCVPNLNACGGGSSSSGGDASATSAGSGTGTSTSVCTPSGGAGNCSGYAAPGTASTCKGCSGSSSTCAANGCYGGWYCDTATSKCHAPPSGCSGGGTTTCPVDAGGGGTSPGGSGSGSSTTGGTTPTTISGTVTSTGGTVSSLLFAIVGDTRPANEDDTAGYPTTIIDTIFTNITARSPQPSFVVSTGDYQFANPTGTTSAPQVALYMAARAKFPGVQFPAMGNHECTGYTASNCGSGNTDGVTSNYTNFLNTMLGPIGQTKPYYAIKISATDGSWTSKFVFVAANAWDSTQSSWLETTLAEATTYTFVIRHEANEANTAPGTTPSENIVTKYPLTLEICGHTHDYSKSGNRIVMGNGGAPLTGNGDYGYGVVAQRSDGAIVVDEIDYKTGAVDASFHFVVTPTGTITN